MRRRPPGPDPTVAVAARDWEKPPLGAFRITDVVITVVLFGAQLTLAAVSLLSYFALPMSNDQCAYQVCGDQKWITWAMWVAAASNPVGLLFALGAVFLLAGRTFASWSALLGCGAQATMIAGAWMIAGSAGPN